MTSAPSASSASATATAAAMAPPKKLPAFDPTLVAKLGPDGVQRLAVAVSVCDAAVSADEKGKLSVGCRTCPPFEAKAAIDGVIAAILATDKTATFYPLESWIGGSFSRAGANEGMAVFAGCESHAENYGGTLLVEKDGEAWAAKEYRSGLHPEKCIPLSAPDGHTIAICRWQDGHQSFFHDTLLAYDFTKGSASDIGPGWTNLATIDTDAYIGCMDPRPLPVSAGKIVDFRVEGLEVVAEVDWGQSKKSQAYKSKCREMEAEMAKDNGRFVEVTKAIPQKRARLVWKFDSATLVPSAETATRLKDMQVVDLE